MWIKLFIKSFPGGDSQTEDTPAGASVQAVLQQPPSGLKKKLWKKQVISTVRAKCIDASFIKSKEQERAFLVLHFCSDEVNIFRSLNLNDILKYSWKWKDWSI